MLSKLARGADKTVALGFVTLERFVFFQSHILTYARLDYNRSMKLKVNVD